ncbi:MAG: flavin reductase family protein [Chloroflexota bacterium]|nr:MAG: flavin reductase family protein [Chloroflexota bacterium]
MILKPDELSAKENHKLLIGTILPRPIAWVSSMDAGGALNLAPYSFFTVGSRNPMTLIFCPLVAGQAGSKKDTLRNIEQRPEFVVNLTNEVTAEAMNRTATDLPPSESEFEWAGVTPAASETIAVPRVAEAPVAFECRLQRIVTISEEPGGGSAVFGEVQCIHIRDDIYVDGYVSLEALQPIGRLAGASYSRVTDTFEIERLPRTH